MPAERAILGIILKSEQLNYKGLINLDEIFSALTPEMFYDPSNAEIYKVMLGLRAKNKPIDVVTLPEALIAKHSPVSTLDVIELETEVSAVTNFKFYVNKVIDSYSRRMLSYAFKEASINVTNQVLEKSEVINKVQAQIDSLEAQGIDDGVRDMYDVIQDVMARKEENALFKTEIDVIDRYINFRRGEVNLILGTPGMGKTTLTMRFMDKAQKTGLKCLYISLDTGDEIMAKRCVAIQQKISVNDVFRNKNLMNRVKPQDVGNYQFVEHTCQTVESIYRAILKHKPDVITIDHNMKLQTETKIDSSWQKYEYMASYLSDVALKTKTCIFLICRLNRNEGKTLQEIIHGSSSWGYEATTVLHLTGEKQEGVQDQEIKLKVHKTRNSCIMPIYIRFRQEYLDFFSSSRLDFDAASGSRVVEYPSKNKYNRGADE